MPIDISLLPAPLTKVKKINFLFWFVGLLAMILIASVAVLILNLYNPLPVFLFVVFSIIIPFIAWLLSFLFYVLVHGHREAYVNKWNQYRQEQQQELINFARRGLFVLLSNVITKHGDTGNGIGVATHQFSLEASNSSNINHLSYSALPLIEGSGNFDHQSRLKTILQKWRNEQRLLFKKVPTDLNVHVRFFVECSEKFDFNNLWLDTFINDIQVTSIESVDVKNSTKFIEDWLDDIEHDNDILLIIAVHFFNVPSNNESEFASLFLLAGEQVILHPNYANTEKPNSYPKVYRNVQSSTLTKTIDDALLWGGSKHQDYEAIWLSGVSNTQHQDIMKHLNEIKFEVKNILNIDHAIGYAGQATYWLSLALAIENALVTEKKQLIMIGSPELSSSVTEYNA